MFSVQIGESQAHLADLTKPAVQAYFGLAKPCSCS